MPKPVGLRFFVFFGGALTRQEPQKAHKNKNQQTKTLKAFKKNLCLQFVFSVQDTLRGLKNKILKLRLNKVKKLLQLLCNPIGHVFFNSFLGKDIRFLALRVRRIARRAVFAMSGLDH